jgi:hypothetical protein
MLENGKGCNKDYVRALDSYKSAAVRKYARAQTALGSLYYNGFGTKRNYVEAVTWYTLASENGNANAYYNLGICNEFGKGVKIDYNIAKSWYGKSAEKGHLDGTCRFAYMFMNENEIMKALNLFHIAISFGW